MNKEMLIKKLEFARDEYSPPEEGWNNSQAGFFHGVNEAISIIRQHAAEQSSETLIECKKAFDEAVKKSAGTINSPSPAEITMAWHFFKEAWEAQQREIAEQDASFDLRWKADMRAIKRWQETTGEELTWPDHADLCVWLMEQLDQRGEITDKEIEQLAVSRIATWLYQQYDKEYDAKYVPVDTWQKQAQEIWGLVKHYPKRGSERDNV